MASKRARSLSPAHSTSSTPPSSSPAIHKSNPITDRSSTFIAAFSPTLPTSTLQSLPEFSTATHRITAWRALSKQRTLSAQPMYDSGHSDDGEQYAGKKLENLLWNMDVAGSVVVARWYGGVMLGPVRFTHIEEVAKEAVREWRSAVVEEGKRKKVEEAEEVERKRLVGVLKGRDESIVVLRDLLAEKLQKKESEGKSPAKPMNYEPMNLQVLKRLEKARDGTISWILKEIDKAEENQKAVEIGADSLPDLAEDNGEPKTQSTTPERQPNTPEKNLPLLEKSSETPKRKKLKADEG